MVWVIMRQRGYPQNAGVLVVLVGSDNGLSLGWHQVIIWTNAGLLLIGPLGTNFSEILIEIYTFSFKKRDLKMLSEKNGSHFLSAWMCLQKLYCRSIPMEMSWWRHQMETFSGLLVLWEGNPPVTGGFPPQRPVMWSFDVFFDAEQTAKQTIRTPVIWDAIALIMASL